MAFSKLLFLALLALRLSDGTSVVQPTRHEFRTPHSYNDAIQECREKHRKRLCSEEELCPSAKEGKAFDGVGVPGMRDAWVAMKGSADAWIQLAEGAGHNICKSHYDMYRNPHPCQPDHVAVNDVACTHTTSIFCCDGTPMQNIKAEEPLCSDSWCTSPGIVGTDCWAGSDVEPCTCSKGQAKQNGRSQMHEGKRYYQYTCCDDVSGIGEHCGDYKGELHDEGAGFIIFLVVVCCCGCIGTGVGIALCYFMKCCCWQPRTPAYDAAAYGQPAYGQVQPQPLVVGAVVAGAPATGYCAPLQPAQATVVAPAPAQATVISATPVQGTVVSAAPVQGNGSEDNPDMAA